LGITGTVRKVEVTHGGNGWHPHLHITFLSLAPLSESELAEVEGYVFAAWRDVVEAAGYRSPLPGLSPLYALRLDTPEWAEYLGKMLGWELAGEGKRSRSIVGRTPFELLGAAVEMCRGLSHAGVGRLIEGTEAITGRPCDVTLW